MSQNPPQAGIILLPPEQGGMTEREEGKRGDLTSLGNLTKFQEVLKEGGISDNTAHIWQKIAKVPESGSLKY